MYKTHSIRNNKDKTTRILTFSKLFEEELFRAHPFAVRWLISALTKETGSILSHEQTLRLERILQIPYDSDARQYRVLMWLNNGARLLDAELVELLNTMSMAAQAILKEGKKT